MGPVFIMQSLERKQYQVVSEISNRMLLSSSDVFVFLPFLSEWEVRLKAGRTPFQQLPGTIKRAKI